MKGAQVEVFKGWRVGDKVLDGRVHATITGFSSMGVWFLRNGSTMPSCIGNSAWPEKADHERELVDLLAKRAGQAPLPGVR